MIVVPRIAFAFGGAGAAGAALVLSGRADGSVLTVLALAAAARAAPAAASGTPAGARSLSLQFSLVPAWIGIGAVGAMRAGSAIVGDARGANAVAGLAIVHGSALTVIAAWLALAAGTIAIWAPSAGARTWGVAVTPEPFARLEVIAIAIQAALLLTLFAGPQVRAGTDVVPWVLGAVATAVAAMRAPRLADRRRLPAIAIACAGVAVVLVVAGGGP